MPCVRRRGRPRTAWIDNIKSWTGHSVEESVRMTEDRDKWGKYVHGVPTLGSRKTKEQNRTKHNENVITYNREFLWSVNMKKTLLIARF